MPDRAPDDSLRGLLKNFADDIKSDLKKQIQDNADISIKNHEETRKEITGIKGEVHGLTNTVNVLWRKVNGPNIPPPKSSGEFRQVDVALKKEKPLSQSVSDHNLDLASLKGQVTALDTKFEKLGEKLDAKSVELSDKVDAAHDVAKQVLVLNEKQNESLGIGVSVRRIGEFFQWAKTKEGQRYVATLFGAATSLVTALGTSYALVTHRLPNPAEPLPMTVRTVYVPVPAASLDAGAP